MKTLIFIFVVLIGSVAFALLAKQDPGYLLISVGPWTVESTFTLFLVVLVSAFALLYFLIRLLLNTWRLPRRLGNWRRLRRAAKAGRATNRGLIALAEGHWAEAERYLTRYADATDTPLLNYLGAARAAQKLNAENRRDDYLSQAHRSTPSAELAVGLTQAEVQLSHGQLEQALATLMHLRRIAPKHTHVLYLLKRLYERLGSWGDLAELLPDLRKRKVLPEEALTALERKTHGELLAIALRSGQLQALHEAWQRVPKGLQQETALLERYAQGLISAGAHSEAEQLLRNALRHDNLEPRLLRLYGQVESKDPARQLSQAEGWLNGHEHDPNLLLTLGKLALRNDLWGKARSYLEASLGIEPRAETYRQLGELLAQMGEEEEANACCRKGLALSTDGRALVPVSATPRSMESTQS